MFEGRRDEFGGGAPCAPHSETVGVSSAGGRRGACPYDQFRGRQRPRVRRPRAHQLDPHRNASAADRIKIESHRRQRRLKKSGLGNVVESDDAHVSWRLAACFPEGMDEPERHLVVGDEYGFRVAFGRDAPARAIAGRCAPILRDKDLVRDPSSSPPVLRANREFSPRRRASS